MKSIDDQRITNNLIGSWTLTKHVDDKTGITFDNYLPNGIKISELLILHGSDVKTISAKSTWAIENGILLEEIIEIDKKFSKKYGLKVGHKIRSYVVECFDDEVTFKLLGKKNSLQSTYYRQITN